MSKLKSDIESISIVREIKEAKRNDEEKLFLKVREFCKDTEWELKRIKEHCDGEILGYQLHFKKADTDEVDVFLRTLERCIKWLNNDLPKEK